MLAMRLTLFVLVVAAAATPTFARLRRYIPPKYEDYEDVNPATVMPTLTIPEPAPPAPRPSPQPVPQPAPQPTPEEEPSPVTEPESSFPDYGEPTQSGAMQPIVGQETGPGIEPGMEPGLEPSLEPGMEPGIEPGMKPGMGYEVGMPGYGRPGFGINHFENPDFGSHYFGKPSFGTPGAGGFGNLGNRPCSGHYNCHSHGPWGGPLHMKPTWNPLFHTSFPAFRAQRFHHAVDDDDDDDDYRADNRRYLPPH